MSRHQLAVLCLTFAAACGGSDAGTRIPGYLTSDGCYQYGDPGSCADAGCAWTDLGVACPADTACPSGVCYQPDPCHAHGDADSCTADTGNACQWADVDLCPPDTDSCPGGFCYAASGDDCTCVCPLYCPQGEDCPPCDCSCGGGGGGGGGGTCTCACPDCPDGDTCPPCDCTCDGGSGCSGDGTCTCVCPECDPSSTDCPPCDCSCDAGGGSSGGGTETCTCPACPPDQTCPPCDCQGSTDPAPSTDPDPCTAYTDEAACLADTADQCGWFGFGIPCMPDVECQSGVCQGPSSGGGGDGGCTCVCPDCDPASPDPCPPCDCNCTGTGCVAPQTT